MQVPIQNSLGGNMNQDASKALVKPTDVYFSQNYNVITTDGATNFSRTNTIGNTLISTINSLPSVTKFSINELLASQLIINEEYTLVLDINSVPVTYTFVFSTIQDLMSGLATEINTIFVSNVAIYYSLPSPHLLISVGGITTITVASFTPTTTNLLVNLTGFINKSQFSEPTANQNGWTLSPTFTTPNRWVAGFVNKNGSTVYALQPETQTATNVTYTLSQSLPVTLQSGDYRARLYMWANTIFQGTSSISVNVAGTTMGTEPLTSGEDRSGIGSAQALTYNTTITPSNNDITITINNTVSINPATFTMALWKFELFGPGIYTDLFEVTNGFISGTGGLNIIGWVNLRDDIYLFTTDNSDEAPINSRGQVWKLAYDKTLDPSDPSNYTLSLIYNNILNFSTKHPIFNPGRVEARYESPEIQKIYWTDNYNQPRVINVADPNVASLAPEELDLLPSIDFDIPVVSNILKGGNLKSGMYQYFYRLKRSNGAESRFSMPSQTFFLTVYDEYSQTQGSFINYEGVDAGVTVDKTIELTLNNLDTSYNRIEVGFIYYGKANSVGTAQVFYEGVVNSDTLVVKHTGEEDSSFPVSIDELTAFAVDITRVKALAAKNNTLFLSNVTVKDFLIDFDSRAYRFPLNSTTTTVRDNNGTYTIDSTNDYKVIAVNGVAVTPYDLPKEHDAIQDYDSQSPFSTNNLLYKPNSLTPDKSLLGGSGPNISYKFESPRIIADELFRNQVEPATGTSIGAPYREVLTRNNNPIQLGDRVYPTSSFYQCYVSPYYAPLMAGYQRDEMYRFAIVFFNKNGNPSFAKWIADIRIPHVYMPIGTNKEDRDLTYPTVEFEPIGAKTYTKPIYLNFNIDVSSIQDQISGFQICVVPRTENDKHIIGQGLFNFAEKDSGSGISGYAFYMSGGTAEGSGGSGYFAKNTQFAQDLWHNVGSIKSPDFDFRGFPGYQTGDSIEFIGLLNPKQQSYIASNPGVSLDGSANISWTSRKYYEYEDTANIPYAIKDANADGPIYTIHEAFNLLPYTNELPQALSISSLLNFNASARVGNFSPLNSSSTIGRSSRGSNKVGIVFSGNAPTSGNINGSADFLSAAFSGRDYPALDGWLNQEKAYVVNYRRNLNAQYNGNTYSQRAANLYKPCSNYYKLNSTGIYSKCLVAGGDTYTLIYDTVYDFVDWWRQTGSTQGITSVMDPAGAGTTVSTDSEQGAGITIHLPVETTINTELRGVGNVPNNYDPPGNAAGSGTIDDGEDFIRFDTDLFSWNPYYMVHVSEPLDYVSTTEFDVRTYKTEPKNNNEDVDSWSIIRPFSFLDADSKYGPINNLIVFKDKLLYFQDRGFGIFQVSEKQVLKDPTSVSELVLGSSGILQRYDYLSTIVGSKLQSGFAVNDSEVLFTDILARKVYTFSNQGINPISDLKGMSSFFYRKFGGNPQMLDNPIEDTGLTATYDYRNNEFLLSFLDREDNEYFTIAYNKLTDGFTSFYTFYPRMYINDKLNVFTVPANLSSGNSIYIHNYGSYGVFYNTRVQPSLLSFIVNQEPNVEKVLTNLEFITESYTTGINDYDTKNPFTIAVPYNFFNKFRFYNSYQNTDLIDAQLISKRRKTLWNVKVPSNRVLYNNRDEVDIFDTTNISTTRPSITQRLKDRWFIIDTIYENNNNYKFVVTAATSLVMLNPR